MNWPGPEKLTNKLAGIWNKAKLSLYDVELYKSAVTAVVRRSGRLPLRSVADSGEARCALSIRPLLGCAGHFLPSDPRRPARSCGQVRRVADPSSQPHAPRRIRCTRWPDELEGSALEMAHSDDDRSHSKGHDRSSRRSRSLQRPCDRLAAEQLAAPVTGRAHCPVCGAHGTSVAQLEEPRYLWTV